MKNILIIHPGPFGYHTPTYYYCLLLKDKYNITYLGLDENLENKNIPGIRYIHLPAGNNRLFKRASFFAAIRKEVKEEKFDFLLVNYFLFCSFLLLFTRSKVLVEIRTSFIFKNAFKRFIYNSVLVVETRLFKNITTISADLARFLYLPKRTRIIPLGAPKFPPMEKDFESMRILYVGTFYGRNIDVTIRGVSKFIKNYKDKVNIVYSIIGFGSYEEINTLKQEIINNGMEKHIFYHGKIRYPELSEYFERHNIGMSYIPLKRRYDSQPPIKSFEYLLSGMAVLATGTRENVKIINESNGVTTGDSVEDIYQGLQMIFIRMNKFNSLKIQEDSVQYSWESIMDNTLIPNIEDISNLT